jgi:hypothetical protein
MFSCFFFSIIHAMMEVLILLLATFASAVVQFKLSENDLFYGGITVGVDVHDPKCSANATAALLNVVSGANCTLLSSSCAIGGIFDATSQAWFKGPCAFDSALLKSMWNANYRAVIGPVKHVNGTIMNEFSTFTMAIGGGFLSNFTVDNGKCDPTGLFLNGFPGCTVDCTDCKIDGQLTAYSSNAQGCAMPLKLFAKRSCCEWNVRVWNGSASDLCDRMLYFCTQI